jgi:hypothetical protein
MHKKPLSIKELELTRAPTFAFQLEWIESSKLNFFLSGIYSNLKYYDPNYSTLYLNNNYSNGTIDNNSSGILLNNKKINRVSNGISLSAQWKLSE